MSKKYMISCSLIADVLQPAFTKGWWTNRVLAVVKGICIAPTAQHVVPCMCPEGCIQLGSMRGNCVVTRFSYLPVPMRIPWFAPHNLYRAAESQPRKNVSWGPSLIYLHMHATRMFSPSLGLQLVSCSAKQINKEHTLTMIVIHNSKAVPTAAFFVCERFNYDVEVYFV